MNADSSTHPRPIHRWKTLWLGILVIAFLTWAWWQSTHTSVFFRCYQISGRHAGAGISLSRWAPDPKPASPLGWHLQQIDPSNKVWRQASFEAPEILHITHETDELLKYHALEPTGKTLNPRNAAALHFMPALTRGIPGYRAIFLPHWLLILTFTAIWAALLFSRSRRLRHLTKPAG